MLFGLLFSTGAQAASASASASAQILVDISLTNDAPLDFGAMTVGSGGVVVVDAQSNMRSTAGDVVAVGDGAHRAVFTSSAPAGTVLLVTGDSSVVLTRANGNETMIATLVYSGGEGTIPAIVTGGLGLETTRGSQQILVGGMLNVSPAQAAGRYSGTFSLRVSYY